MYLSGVRKKIVRFDDQRLLPLLDEPVVQHSATKNASAAAVALLLTPGTYFDSLKPTSSPSKKSKPVTLFLGGIHSL